MATADKGWYLRLLEWGTKFSIRFLFDSGNPRCLSEKPPTFEQEHAPSHQALFTTTDSHPPTPMQVKSNADRLLSRSTTPHPWRRIWKTKAVIRQQCVVREGEKTLASWGRTKATLRMRVGGSLCNNSNFRCEENWTSTDGCGLPT